MTTAAIRDKLHDFISLADDEKIKNIYELFEDQMAPVSDWSEDEEFVAELNDRVRRLNEGIDKGLSIEEVEASLERKKENEKVIRYNELQHRVVTQGCARII